MKIRPAGNQQIMILGQSCQLFHLGRLMFGVVHLQTLYPHGDDLPDFGLIFNQTGVGQYADAPGLANESDGFGGSEFIPADVGRAAIADVFMKSILLGDRQGCFS